MRRHLALLAVFALAACSGGGDDEGGKRRLFSPDAATRDASAPFDFSRPGDALALDADEVARKVGSFDWTTAIEWTVERQGDEARRVRAVERHRVRQAATGEFEVSAEIDPGLGPGSDTGRDVVFTAGETWARGRYAPWRERPTDRGRDARRFRDESFGAAAEAARLFGDALVVAPAGETKVLGRAARRFTLSLARDARPPEVPLPPPGSPPDDDTRRRRTFLSGRVPQAADGELVLDATTGAPLRVRLAGAFGVKDEPNVRATFELLAQVKALGAEVQAVHPPKGALPDERKASGVAGALDAAGLRKRGEEKPAAPGEPADDAAE